MSRKICLTILLPALLVPCVRAESLGRLFYTPAQRTQLEREHGQAGEHRAARITLNGIVQRSDGARTVWINGAAQNADDSGIQTPDTHTVFIPGKSQALEIKVGQYLSLEQAPEK